MNRIEDNKTETKLSHIDSIRGIAILMVILTHVSQTVKGLGPIEAILSSYGQMGVQLFFVASAYTLCLSANNRMNESQALIKYTIRRFFRIAPLYYIGMFLYLIIEIFINYYYDIQPLWPIKYSVASVLANILFLNGFYEPGNNNIVPGGWSIGTEMAFYALFPAFFFFVKKNKIFTLSSFLLIVVAIQLLSISALLVIDFFSGYTIQNNSFLYFNIINQLPVFCIGMGYYFTEKEAVFKRHWLFDMTMFALLTCIIQYLWHLDKPFLFTIIPTICALSFVFLINIFKKLRYLNFNFLMRFGILSYSMYIFHVIFAHKISGIVSLYIERNMILNNSIYVLTLLYIMSVLGTFLLAVMSEKYIERPFIKRGRDIIRKIDVLPKITVNG